MNLSLVQICNSQNHRGNTGRFTVVKKDFDYCEFAQGINLLKFLLEDFSTLRTSFTNFLH